MKIKKRGGEVRLGGSGSGGGGVRVAVNGECSFCENSKKKYFFLGGGGGGGRRVGGQGGCERRSKVFVKIQKKN